MTKLKCLVAAVALVGVSTMGASAQPGHDEHHPAAGEQGAPAAATAAPPRTAPQTGMMGAQGMMGGMPMMNMMAMMQMMGGGDASAMGMAEHVEGRIAFLRTELKITDAQSGAWNELAAALRENAHILDAARPAMMAQMGCCQTEAQSVTQRLDAQERWLSARLQGTHTIKAAVTKLYAVLSANQRKTADELLAPQIGMMAMPMAQMGGMAPRVQ